jgi:hypothetical protein
MDHISTRFKLASPRMVEVNADSVHLVSSLLQRHYLRKNQNLIINRLWTRLKEIFADVLDTNQSSNRSGRQLA